MANNGISKATMSFLKDLKKNNDRAWFEKHRDRFEAAHEEFSQTAQGLIEQIARLDPGIRPVSLKDSIFRIYRDVRFSRDKSPYKPHFSFFAARGGRKSKYAGYYVHLEPGSCFIGGGIYHPEPENLMKIRTAIATRGEELRRIVQAVPFRKYYKGLEGDRLKNPPRQYAKDHPLAEFLCFKDFIASAKLKDTEVTGDLAGACIMRFRALLPFNRWLSRAVDQDS